MTETLYLNSVLPEAAIAMSVVTPFHKNDPALLLEILARQGKGLPIELIVVDDGSGASELTQQVKKAIDAFPVPAGLITFHTNQGRSAARNRLIAQAKGPYILFLDSDMAPDSETFLQDWLDLITKTKPTIAYGGFTTLQVPKLPELALARALAERGDCHSARDRVPRGALAVATSNLLVRADIMREVSFDSDFTGWGWEDVDWALRAVAAGFAISHVPIPATHMGLDTPEVLLDKFAKAGPNFRRIVARHPNMQTTSGTKLARLFGYLPFQGPIRKTLYALAINNIVPLPWRSRAARIWRALWASYRAV
jgi:glycosyltransferase involved in cell wall biosynthesis